MFCADYSQRWQSAASKQQAPRFTKHYTEK
jgi:hypothetical protein